MKSNKKTMIAAALAVAVVALAGVGYATLDSYKAVTINGNNDLDSEYLVLSQSGNGMYQGDLFKEDSFFYDTLNFWNTSATPAATVTLYKPLADKDISAAGVVTDGDEYALVSDEFNLVIDKTHASDVNSVKLDITVTNFVPVPGLSYVIVLSGGESSTAVTLKADYVPASENVVAGWHFPSVNISSISTFAVGLYIGIDTSSTAVVSVTEAQAGQYAGNYIPEDANIASAGFNVDSQSQTPKSAFTFVVTPVSA